MSQHAPSDFTGAMYVYRPAGPACPKYKAERGVPGSQLGKDRNSISPAATSGLRCSDACRSAS